MPRTLFPSLARRGAYLASALVTSLVLCADADAQTLLKDRNIGVSRNGATQLPRGEGDQALVDGWPLYRTERSQEAFNAVMAALKATDIAAPTAAVFKGCAGLDCELSLPALQPDGWLQPGRIWLSPTEYVLIAHSPRLSENRLYRRRMHVDMKYFVLHEFQNSSRNTDVFDTISAHKASVFVPLYMSRQATDARGHRFVTVVQVAPYNVISIHASNKGSSGPGMEVAKNSNDALEPLQGLAGIIVSTVIKMAAPQLRVVNHRGVEGLPMLTAYEQRLARLRQRQGAAVALPFTPATPQRIANADGALGDLIQRKGVSPSIPIADRGFLPPKPTATLAAFAPTQAASQLMPPPVRPFVPPSAIAVPTPAPALSRLAVYLRSNLATMMRLPQFASIIPPEVTSIAVNSPDTGTVFALNKSDQIIGKFAPLQDHGVTVNGQFIYAAMDRPTDKEAAFSLDLSKPIQLQSAAATPSQPQPEPLLLEPTHAEARPARR